MCDSTAQGNAALRNESKMPELMTRQSQHVTRVRRMGRSKLYWQLDRFLNTASLDSICAPSGEYGGDDEALRLRAEEQCALS